MATRNAGTGNKSNKKKPTARARETERRASEDRAEQSPRVPASKKTYSHGRYPGSTATADDELARNADVRPARGSRTPVLTTAKRSERPRPERDKRARRVPKGT